MDIIGLNLMQAIETYMEQWFSIPPSFYTPIMQRKSIEYAANCLPYRLDDRFLIVKNHLQNKQYKIKLKIEKRE